MTTFLIHGRVDRPKALHPVALNSSMEIRFNGHNIFSGLTSKSKESSAKNVLSS